MNLYFLKQELVDQMKEDIKENIDKYQELKSDWISEESFGKYEKNFPDFKLDMSKKKPHETDLNNIKILYSKLKELKDSQAADERVWAGLCHKEFWGYMKYRWPSIEEKNIKQHYFFGDNHPTFLNGLSRLWWTGRLTYDENAENPFELTEYICKDLNGRGGALFAVNISNNKKIVRTFLRTLMEFEKKKELSRQEFLKVKEIMVLWGGKMILDSLSPKELSQKINDYLNEVSLKKEDEKIVLKKNNKIKKKIEIIKKRKVVNPKIKKKTTTKNSVKNKRKVVNPKIKKKSFLGLFKRAK